MKKKYANYPNIKEVLEKEFIKKEIVNNDNYACACLLDIKSVSKKWEVPRENGTEIVLDNNYKWLTLYPTSENYSIITIFDDKNELKEMYFDIAKKVKYKARIPFTKDLYLDIVLTKENNVRFVDEEELNEALKNGDIKQKDYELARKTADKIVNKYHKPEEFEKLKEFAKQMLYECMEIENRN